MDFQHNNASVIEGNIKWRHPFLAVILATFCLLTVSGNCLVVIAVCTKKYLRNPTGYLIISLAIADLIVGLVVMPLNSLFEMANQEWLLGLAMCDLFHALDILASTSSIWNLCVISLDRYMAGQDPIGYRDKVSKRRILIAICCMWMVSACLAFPAILWWRAASPQLYENKNKCIFTDSTMYIIFSSLVSFYIPLCLILFAYGKVFLIATRHSRGMRTGIRKVKYKNGQQLQLDTQNVLSNRNEPTLRIHIGRKRSLSRHFHHGTSNDSKRILLQQVSPKNLNDREDRQVRVQVTVGKHASINTAATTTANDNNHNISGSNNNNNNNVTIKSKSVHQVQAAALPRYHSNTISVTTPNYRDDVRDISTPSSPHVVRRKLNVKERSRQVVKYVHEQRAARTLSIVVGAFILCWAPFFVFSPLAVLCNSVVWYAVSSLWASFSLFFSHMRRACYWNSCFMNKEKIFTIVTWAGHLNSMLNPLIYSRFSRDFRRAFKQILTCQREQKTKMAFKTPLSLVFTQLISVTQMWDHTQTTSIEC